MLHSDKPSNAVATEQGLDRDTVAVHLVMPDLQKVSMACFRLPRSGAPRKFPAEHIQIMCDWARAEALTAPQLRERLQESSSASK